MTPKLFLITTCLILSGCARVKSAWGGFDVGVQQSGQFDRRPGFDSSGVYGTANIKIGNKNKLKFGVIEPMRGGEPNYKVAIERRLF